MLIVALFLGFCGIGLFCWLIFSLAIYALPIFVGLWAGIAAFRSGAGALGALVIGVVTGAVTLGAGQIAFALVTSVPLRAAIAGLFAIPAAIVGYHAVLALSQFGIASLFWRDCFALVGAVAVGCTAFARMTVLSEHHRPGTDEAAPDRREPVLTAAPRKI